MAVSVLAHEVSDLCLGKPALRGLSVSATVGDALSALKRAGESYLSLWSCSHDTLSRIADVCRCVGKVCMVDIICFLCKEENLRSPSTALQSPVSVLIPKTAAGLVRHLEPHARLVEAIDLILEGAQNLVIPIPSQSRRKKLLQKSSSKSTVHNNREYCWITQEDIIRYLLNSIGLFCPTPINPINTLNVINADNILAIHYHDPALVALPLITQSLINHTSVAIVDEDGKLIGEISPFTLNSCDENVAAAIATLSAGDLMAYIDCGGPPDDLVQVVKDRLEEQKLEGALELMEEESTITSSSSSLCSSSSDEEFGSGRSGRLGRVFGEAGEEVRSNCVLPMELDGSGDDSGTSTSCELCVGR